VLNPFAGSRSLAISETTGSVTVATYPVCGISGWLSVCNRVFPCAWCGAYQP
jgi:hypothetical protein